MSYYSFSEAWTQELRLLRQQGESSSPRGMPTLERRWVEFQVDDPMTIPLRVSGREFKDVIGVLEATSLVGQFSVPELFIHHVVKFKDFTDAGVFHGSYGARVHGRLGDLVSLMVNDPDTRQAVLTIYDSRSDLGVDKTDIPCTVALHFLLRHGRLEMKTVMRSNDIWLGTPYDFVQFAVLQASIAQALGVKVGRYTHSAGSLHLYEHDAEKAAQVVFEGGPPMPFPLWNISHSDDPIHRLEHISMRARWLALHPEGFREGEMTKFEEWARGLLSE